MPNPDSGVLWNPVQTEALVAAESFLLLGPAGSGKTLVLKEKARRLVAAGQKAALAGFAYRAMAYARQTTPELGFLADSGRIAMDVVHELAARQLDKSGMPPIYASNNQVRRILRGMMVEQSFPGSLHEALIVVRGAKGRAKKLPESDRFYPFVKAYQARLDELGLSDRHDLVRRHVLGMKDGSVPPLPVDWLLLDSVQDATELQLIWLQLHAVNGVKLGLAADDDVTTFGREGAMGATAIQTIQGWGEAVGLQTLELPHHYRLAPELAEALEKQARQLRLRQAKKAVSARPAATEPVVVAKSYSHLPALHAAVLDLCKEKLAAGQRVGLITRTDFAAAALAHVLRRGGLNPASLARLIWEDPTPQLVLASLHVLLDDASPARLALLLLGLGIPAATVAEWQEGGDLAATDWLSRGANLPLSAVSSPTVANSVQHLRWAFRSAAQLWAARALPPAKVFKALWADLLPLLPPREHQAALLALDMLLSLSGRLQDALPRVMEETLPDMTSPITVAPVREVRHHQFDTVVLVNASADSWPAKAGEALGIDHDNERRLWLLAASRSRAALHLTYVQEPCALASELMRSLKLTA